MARPMELPAAIRADLARVEPGPERRADAAIARRLADLIADPDTEPATLPALIRALDSVRHRLGILPDASAPERGPSELEAFLAAMEGE